MLFDRPAELPVATLRSRSWSAVGARLHGSVVARWRWFRPRTLPVVVALAGMVALLESANYLSNLARHTPERAIPSGSRRITSRSPRHRQDRRSVSTPGGVACDDHDRGRRPSRSDARSCCRAAAASDRLVPADPPR
jgi:hypothetical protein